MHVFSKLKNCSYKLLVSQKCTDKPEGFGSKNYPYFGSDEDVCLILQEASLTENIFLVCKYTNN